MFVKKIKQNQPVDFKKIGKQSKDYLIVKNPDLVNDVNFEERGDIN